MIPESTNRVVPWWANGYRTPDRILAVMVIGSRVVAIGESGTKYVIGVVEDIWPLPKGNTA